MPKVSVIIPVYNVERFLPRCLDSVLKQTFEDFEVICVNDGSTDKCYDILESFRKSDKRIHLVNQNNQGLSMARNNGLRIATGEYVYFLDSDDAIHPQCLELVICVAEEYNADLVSFQFENCIIEKYDDKAFFEKKINGKELNTVIAPSPLNYVLINKKNKIHYNVWTKFYKRRFLEGVNFIRGIQFEDYPHTFEVLSKHPKTVILEESLYLYTINPNSISNQSGNLKQIRDYHIGVSHVYNVYKKVGSKTEIEYLKKVFMPDILKQQLIKCKTANKDMRKMMYAELKEEFEELSSNGMINWLDRRVLKCFLYCYLYK